MNKKLVAKAILLALPKIDGYCEMVARKNYKQIMKSFGEEVGTYELVETIINKIHMIQQLHNLKIKVMKRIKNMPRKYSVVLLLHFVLGYELLEIAEYLNMDFRTIGRHIDDIITWFADKLDDRFVEMIHFRSLVLRCGLLRDGMSVKGF